MRELDHSFALVWLARFAWDLVVVRIPANDLGMNGSLETLYGDSLSSLQRNVTATIYLLRNFW